MDLLQSLRDLNLWEPIEPAAQSARFFMDLRNPIILNNPGVSLKVLKTARDPGATDWYLVVKSAHLDSQSYVIKFEDSSLYQYVFITAPPEKIGAGWQLVINRVFRSRYHRESRRFETMGSGWFVSDFQLPAATLDPALRKTLIRTIFQSYRQMLQREIQDVLIDQYIKQDDQLLQKMEVFGRPFLLEDTRHARFYQERTHMRVGEDAIEFLCFQDLSDDNPEEAMRRYHKMGVLSDLILPILFDQPGGERLNIGYIRVYTPEREGRTLDREKLPRLLEVGQQIVQSIRLSNYEVFDLHEAVVDASKNGIALEITEAVLRERLRSAARFQCRLYFKPDAPPLRISVDKVYQRDGRDGLRIGGKLRNIQLTVTETAEPDSGRSAYAAALKSLGVTDGNV